MDKHIENIKKNSFEYVDSLSIETLEKIIKYTAEKYYTFEEEVITDAEYDMLIDFLKLKNPKSKVLKTIGSKNKKKNYQKLPYRLGSMDKIKPPSKKLKTYVDQHKNPYYLSDKLDGISALLVYFNNNEIKLYTRGDATEGLDISNLIKYLSIPNIDKIRSFMKSSKIKETEKLMAFRGELIIKKKIFKSNWERKEKNDKTKFKNARNAISGLIVSKIPNPKLANDTNLVMYEVVDPIVKISDQYKFMKNIGFKVVHHKIVRKSINFEYLSEYFKKRRKESKYEIDGIIVNNNKVNQRDDLSASGNPNYAFAFKDILEDQKAVTEVLSLEWNISKNGLIVPTIILKPVIIGGVEVKRVTGHHAKFVIDSKIDKGAIIQLIRSGDVIPKVVKVIKKAKKVNMPSGNYHWSDTKVDLICNDCDLPEIKMKRIEFFFKSLKTKGLGEKVVEKLYNANYDTIKKILSATKDDFLKLEGFKDKSAENLVNSIKNSTKNVSLVKIMAASNTLGAGLGERKIKLILEKYPNLITDYKKWKNQEFIDKIIELDGWNTKTATLFVESFPNFIIFYNNIKNLISFKKKITIKKSKFNNIVIVTSGFKPKDSLAELIVKLNIINRSTVSKKTDYLIVKDKSTIEENTGKVKKANDLNVKILTKDSFSKMISK